MFGGYSVLILEDHIVNFEIKIFLKEHADQLIYIEQSFQFTTILGPDKEV